MGLLLALAVPPHVLLAQLRSRPGTTLGQLAATLAAAFALVLVADVVLVSRLRGRRPGALLSFVCGVVATALALSWFFTALAVVVAPVGILAGLATRAEESMAGDPHDAFNRAGLILSLLAAVLVVAWVVLVFALAWDA